MVTFNLPYLNSLDLTFRCLPCSSVYIIHHQNDRTHKIVYLASTYNLNYSVNNIVSMSLTANRRVVCQFLYDVHQSNKYRAYCPQHNANSPSCTACFRFKKSLDLHLRKNHCCRF